jgi:predicted cupin superfamily sugar epimerase
LRSVAGACLAPKGKRAFMGCALNPGFNFDDYEEAIHRNVLALLAAFMQTIKVLPHPGDQQ